MCVLRTVAGQVRDKDIGGICPNAVEDLQYISSLNKILGHILGLKLTQSSPLLIIEFSIITLLLR